MPNVGAPSRGCLPCRQRHVKCDLTRPHCRRCIRKGLSCLGYRDEWDMRFRVETVNTYQSAIGRDRRRKPSPSSQYCPLSPGNYLSNLISDRFVPLVLYHFSCDTADNDCSGYPVNIISHLFSAAQEGSPLYNVIKTLGCSYLLKSSRSYDNASQAEVYGDSLVALNRALRDPTESTSDGTLLSVWLLRVYELTWCVQSGVDHTIATARSDLHMNGMAEILRLRGRKQFLSAEGREIFCFVFCTLLTRTIATGRDIPAESFDWLRDFIQHTDRSTLGSAHTAVFSYNCFLICIEIQRLINLADPKDLLSRSKALLDDVDDIENTTYRAIGHLESSPGPHQVELGCFADQVFRNDFKMRLLSHALELVLYISHVPSCTPQQRDEFARRHGDLIKEFQDTAQHILLKVATVHNIQSLIECDDLERNVSSDVIRWAHVLRVTHPLRLISQSPFASVGQRKAANNFLKFMYTRVEYV